jgi:hypothetical protein
MIYLKVRYTMPDTPATIKAKSQTPLQALRRIDFLGCILLAFWVGTSLMAISLVTNSTSISSYRWSDPAIVALFVASGLGFIVFLLVELRWAAEPVMPFELLGRGTCVAVGINNFLISVVIFGIVSTLLSMLCRYSKSMLYLDVLGSSVFHSSEANDAISSRKTPYT